MAFDIVAIGDFRFPGGTSTALASEVAILARAGYRIGLIATAGPVLRYPHPVHPAIRALVDQGLAEQIAPNQPVRAGLCLLHHPQVFQRWPERPWHVTADHTLLVVHHPPLDASGQPFYDWAKIAQVTGDMFGHVPWAPVGPLVRAQLRTLPDAPPLHETDWSNVIDTEAWAMPRDGFMGALPVIGRHSRPDPLKWPENREKFLAAYPPDADFRVRLMGYGPEQDAIVGRRPDTWSVLPFGARPVRAFLGAIDYFVYFHHPRWVEAYGRSILEAMATGAVPVLPGHFRPVFGEGAIYCKPEDTANKVRDMHASPGRFMAQSRRAVDVAHDSAGPQVLLARVSDLIGSPGAGAAVVPGGPSPTLPRLRWPKVHRAKVMFVTSNGVGMGHLTRALAVARRLPGRVTPVFVTMSKAFGLALREGFHAEYLPFHRATGTHPDEWNIHLRRELSEALAFHRPDAVVFDGNVPYGGLLAALDSFPAIWRVWMRRGMWAPGSGEDIVTREEAFDTVIEPGDLAGLWDRGITRAHRARTVDVAPVRYLRPDEMLSRAQARHALGLPASGTAVLVQLGSGNNFDMSSMRRRVFDTLLATPGTHVVHADWLIAEATTDLPEGVRRLAEFPLARLLAGFDFTIGAAGYNSYHETLLAGLPALFIPNESAEQDEQHLRARHAALRGMAQHVSSRDPYALDAALAQMLDPARRAEMAAACASLPQDNGADEAARLVADLAMTRRQIEAD